MKKERTGQGGRKESAKGEDEERERKTKGREEQSDRQEKSRHRAGEQGQHFLLLFFFSLSPSHPIFFPPSLLSNLIFITAESLKQFTWSASDMKIDNCDPPFLPGKQKIEG